MFPLFGLNRGYHFAVDYRIVLVGISLLFAVVYNWQILSHFYQILGNLETFDPIFAATAPIVLFCALIAVFVPLSFRQILKPLFIPLILTASAISYGTIRYGIIVDRDMIRNFAETNQAEAFSYLNLQSITWFILTGLLPAVVLLILPIRYPATLARGLGQRGALIGLALVCLTVIGAGYFKDYASVGRNNRVLGKEIVPMNYLKGTTAYVKRRYLARPTPFQVIAEDARVVSSSSKPTLMFLVVGETARAASVAANGYHRPTSPFTAKIRDLITFQNVTACGTATSISVPCMFSHLTRQDFDDEIAKNSENLMDILSKAGVSVLWKENDNGCKDVCDRVPTVDILPSDFPTLCAEGTCFDAVMLERLDSEIEVQGGSDTLITLHLIGSHGPTYYRRYPDSFRFFQPDCPRSDIENCSQEELINTYDNTIRYTDFIIAKLISRLEAYADQYDTALLYVSDHGESLGESGLYLHGAPFMFAPEEQLHIPMMLWMSPSFSSSRQLDGDCISRNAITNSYSHDNIFSTVLSLMQVKTSTHDPKLDILTDCPPEAEITSAPR